MKSIKSKESFLESELFDCLEAFPELPKKDCVAMLKEWKKICPERKTKADFRLLAAFMFPGNLALRAYSLSESGGDLFCVRTDGG